MTLDELAPEIRSGVDLRIVDAQTNEDLTQATLTQLVLETGHAAKFLPVQLLTQMIRLSDDSLAEFFCRYVTGALEMYLQAKRGVQSIAAYNPLMQLPMAATDALARMWMGSPFAAPYQPPYPPGYPAQPQATRAATPACRRLLPRRLRHSPSATRPRPRSARSTRTTARRARAAPKEAAARVAVTAAVARTAHAGNGNRRAQSEPGRRAKTDGGRRAATEPEARADDAAAMRRELDELKQALRDSLPKRKKKKT